VRASKGNTYESHQHHALEPVGSTVVGGKVDLRKERKESEPSKRDELIVSPWGSSRYRMSRSQGEAGWARSFRTGEKGRTRMTDEKRTMVSKSEKKSCLVMGARSDQCSVGVAKRGSGSGCLQ
jgi:hypothetical protein